MSDFIIRDSQAGDLAGIAALQRDAGPELQLPPAEYFPFWQWLCQRNPGGAAKSLVGIDGAGQVIAHKAMVPFPVVCDGQNLTGGLPCQYVVAVPFRATPVYLQMDVRLLAEYPQKGIDFFCGISRARYVRVDESLRFFGFRVVGRLPVYARPYRLVNLARHYLGGGWRYQTLKPLLHAAEWPLRICLSRSTRRADVTQIDAFDDATATSLEAVCQQLGVHTRRSAAWLNWRFFQCPDRAYQVHLARDSKSALGYIALRQMRMRDFDALAVVDIVFPPDRPEVGRALLRQAHCVALETRVDLAACMFNPASSLLPVLRWSGFLRTPDGFSMIVHQPKGAAPLIDAQTFQRWHLTWLEHDYV
jgi:hypothetical protein